MTAERPNRRDFLKYTAGASGVLGIVSTAGCAMVKGSQEPSMEFMQATDELSMFGGAPAHGEYPAEPMEMEMHGGMTMTAVPVQMVAKPDDSDNYHFMPHVLWIEPETTVAWSHADIENISEPRGHSVTSFGAGGLLPRMIPDGASHFDSGFIAGLHGEKSNKRGIDERYNGRISNRLLEAGNPIGRGPFTHTFEEEGVYLYYCQNHHIFRMAGAVVVGEIWGEDGTRGEAPVGWDPAMTADISRLPALDPLHGESLMHQVEELRGFVHAGRAGGGHDE